MVSRIVRLVAAGNRLKNMIETTRPELGAALREVIAGWNEAVEHVLDHAAPPVLPECPLARDFDYLAFDTESRQLLAFGSMAVYALQNADEAHPESAIEILYAGRLGRRIWEERLDLAAARPVLRAVFGAA